MGDRTGHPFRGNQHAGGKPSVTTTQATIAQMAQDKRLADLATGPGQKRPKTAQQAQRNLHAQRAELQAKLDAKNPEALKAKIAANNERIAELDAKLAAVRARIAELKAKEKVHKANPTGINQYTKIGGGGAPLKDEQGRDVDPSDFAEKARLFYGTSAEGKLKQMTLREPEAKAKKGKAVDPAKEAEKAAKAEEKAKKDAEKEAIKAKKAADNAERRQAVMSGAIPVALIPKYLSMGNFSKEERLDILKQVGIDPLTNKLSIPADKAAAKPTTSTRATTTTRAEANQLDWTGQVKAKEEAAAAKKAAAEAKKKPTTSVAKSSDVALTRFQAVRNAHR